MKLPHLVVYTDKVQGGSAKFFVSLINPKYVYDKGLHDHEYEHIKQWYAGWFIWACCTVCLNPWLTILGVNFHPLLYLAIPKYRLWCEVKAYKKQLKYYPEELDYFALVLTQKYRLNLSLETAKSLLKGE